MAPRPGPTPAKTPAQNHMNTRAAIDVSGLPHAVEDHRSPIWWGNLWLLLIESTMFALLVGGILYFRLVDFPRWPPPSVDGVVAILRPLPDLGIGTVMLVVVILSFFPMYWADRACLRRSQHEVVIALLLSVLFGVACVALRFIEFHAFHFRWDSNAYASSVWLLLGLHLAHLITATAENTLMLVWILVHGMDIKHARDVRVTTVYWYWIVGIWIVFYILLYWWPRWNS